MSLIPNFSDLQSALVGMTLVILNDLTCKSVCMHVHEKLYTIVESIHQIGFIFTITTYMQLRRKINSFFYMDLEEHRQIFIIISH